MSGAKLAAQSARELPIPSGFPGFSNILFFNELLTMTGANRAGDCFGHRNVDVPPIRCRPGGAMGTVVVFSEARRTPRQNPPIALAGAATVVILPVVRIEREGTRSPVSSVFPRRDSKPRSGRKRRKRATRNYSPLRGSLTRV
jgi:hypothetical protein